jgi:RHS repeat-associated protein
LFTVSLASQLIPNNFTCSVNGILATQQRKDYSLFGAKLHERCWSRSVLPNGTVTYVNGDDTYRYDFNGKETDAESGYEDFNMRMYRPELGKFLSIDPVANYYPELSTYQFASNTPIWAIDFNGTQAVVILGGGDLLCDGLSQTTKDIESAAKKHAVSIGLSANCVKAFNTPTCFDPRHLTYIAQVKDFIKKNHKPGEPLIIYGYSLGATAAATSILNELKKEDPSIVIDLFITVDPANGNLSTNLEIPSNVKCNINYFQQDPSSVGSCGYSNYAEDKSKTRVINYNQTGQTGAKKGDEHKTMDELNMDNVIRWIKLKLNESPSKKTKDVKSEHRNVRFMED